MTEKDKNGRLMAQQNKPQPRFGADPDFVGPCQHHIGSFLILRYLGFYRKGPDAKGQHKYRVACKYCGRIYERLQASIMKAHYGGHIGCVECKFSIHTLSVTESRELTQRKEIEDLKDWFWVMHTMPVTSIRMRLKQLFDNELAKVLGWRTI